MNRGSFESWSRYEPLGGERSDLCHGRQLAQRSVGPEEGAATPDTRDMEDDTCMTDLPPTLLAKLAVSFGPRTEDLAVEALGHILAQSEATRRALSDMIAPGGADVGEIAQVRTQATGKEGERPDLAGFDRDGRERVLIEAKFWAGLTGNQPVAYLQRLPANTPSALLFVASPTAAR